MFDILAEATQPAAESSWALVFSQLIGVAKAIVMLIVASFAAYHLGIKRERKVRARARKEDLPARILGRLEERAMLARHDLRMGLMAGFWQRAPMVLNERPTEDVKQSVRAYEESRRALMPPIARSSRELITSIEELKALYLNNDAVMSDLAAAITAVTSFDPDDFKLELGKMDGKTLEELSKWGHLKEDEIAGFVEKRLKDPVRAAIKAINNEAGL